MTEQAQACSTRLPSTQGHLCHAESHTSHMLVHMLSKNFRGSPPGLGRSQVEGARCLCSTRHRTLNPANAYTPVDMPLHSATSVPRRLVDDDLLQVPVLLKVVVVHLCLDIDGGNLDDQVICGPIHQLLQDRRASLSGHDNIWPTPTGTIDHKYLHVRT